MQIYLPIAEISANIIYIIFVGIINGIISGLFGIGGSFVGIPLLVNQGIDSSAIIASYTHQMIANSFLSVAGDAKNKRINYKLVFLTFIGGFTGAVLGIFLFKKLTNNGQIDLIVSFLYIFVLGGIASFMFYESGGAILQKYFFKQAAVERNKLQIESINAVQKNFIWKAIEKLPYKVKVNEVQISVIMIIAFGFIAGTLVAIAGIASGLLMIPVMIYIYKMNIRDAMASSNLHGGMIVLLSSILQTVTLHSTDLIFSLILTIGSVIGVTIARKFASKIPPEELRISLAFIMIIVIFKIVLNIVLEPKDIFTISILH